MIGIYSIINKVNGKKYYGGSVDIQKRWNHHKNQLKKQKHPNIILQNSWNKYGENNFEFKIELECFKPFLSWIENIYLPFGENNIAKDATRPMFGRKLSNECKMKMSLAHKGKGGWKLSDECKKKMSLTHKGILKGPQTEQHKLNESLVKKGKKKPLSGERLIKHQKFMRILGLASKDIKRPQHVHEALKIGYQKNKKKIIYATFKRSKCYTKRGNGFRVQCCGIKKQCQNEEEAKEMVVNIKKQYLLKHFSAAVGKGE
jgi:group I intron endonuclease